MKKSFKNVISCALSLSLAANIMSCFSWIHTFAEETTVFYMKPSELPVSDDGAVHISPDEFADGDYTLRVDVFFKDDSQTAWYVSPKIRCASDFIKLENELDPTNPPVEFAYSETDSEGNLVRNDYAVIVSPSQKYNVINFSCRNASYSFTPMIPYGEFSDSYRLTSFDAVINSEIPSGEYLIYFLMEPEDYEDQRVCEVSLRVNGESIGTAVEPQNLRIIIDSEEPVFSLGDVNADGTVDASDASDILAEYARLSTSEPSRFTDTQTAAADIDKNGAVDASDASLVLGYYAYISTNDFIEIEEFIELQNQPSDPPVTSEPEVTTTESETTTTTTTAATTTTVTTTTTSETTTTTTAATTTTTSATTTTTRTKAPVTATTAKVSGNYTGHIYRTKSGSKFHYLNPCGNGTYFECSEEDIVKYGLEPCEKCAY